MPALGDEVLGGHKSHGVALVFSDRCTSLRVKVVHFYSSFHCHVETFTFQLLPKLEE